MPVTRSFSHLDSRQPSSQPYQTRSLSRAGPSNSQELKKSTKGGPGGGAEIIVLSSDDDEPQQKKSKKSKKKGATTDAVPPILSGEVLELSSEDELCPKPKQSQKKAGKSSDAAHRDVQRTIKKLQEELKRAEQRASSACAEVEQLKREASLRSKDNVLSELEEYTTCEVCTLTIWNPYILPECGHSFCENCLLDWFGRTQGQHLATNQLLDGNRAALGGQLRAVLHAIPNVHAIVGPHITNHLQEILREARRLQPEYTCPSCRKQIENKPVEDFRLKGLVKEIATLSGETNPRKEIQHHRTSGPFDNFFPAAALGK